MKNKLQILLLSFFIFIILIIGGCDSESFLPHTPFYDKAIDYNSELTVSFIDAGQGDSTLIECGGEAMLIDASIYSERDNITSYIKKLGINELKYCVATHPHSDHIGSMSEIIYRFDVDTLVYPLCESDSSTMNHVLDACDEKGVTYLNPDPLDTFTLGSATLTVLSPEAYTDYDNLNNNSLVLKLEYEDVSFLFMGDAETEVEYELLNKDFDLNVDVLKAGHHGSSTSSCAEFLNAVTPSVAVISCGKDNDYGHPHRETVSAFNRRFVETYRTDKLSTIVASSDGESITFTAKDGTLGTIIPNHLHEYSYTGNLNSKVFHSNKCDALKNTKEYNKTYFFTRKDAVEKGYNPCKSCNP